MCVCVCVCAMPDCFTAATHIVTSNFSGFLNGKYVLVIIFIHARKELYFILHKSLSSELKIYQIVSCINRVYCARYTVISTVCICRLCHNFKTNLFISSILSNV